jgi:hypothetical protein
MPRYKVQSHDFIDIWNTSSNINEVMSRTGLCRKSVHNRKLTLLDHLTPLKDIPKYKISNQELISNGFGYWLCGLIDGEGHLGLKCTSRKRMVNGKEYSTLESKIILQITLRADDKSALEYILSTLECGYLQDRVMKHRQNPICDYKIAKTSDLVYRVIPIIEACKLQTKKAKEFELWKEAVFIKQDVMVRRTNGYCSREGERLTSIEQARMKELSKLMGEIRHSV